VDDPEISCQSFRVSWVKVVPGMRRSSHTCNGGSSRGRRRGRKRRKRRRRRREMKTKWQQRNHQNDHHKCYYCYYYYYYYYHYYVDLCGVIEEGFLVGGAYRACIEPADRYRTLILCR